MNPQFKKIEDKEKWQELLDRALFKTFFHHLEWEEFLEKNFNWLKFEHYLYKDELLLSLGEYKSLGRGKLISLPFCEYGGPLPLKERIDGREFKKALFSEIKKPFKISFHPHLPRYFKSFGLKEPDSARDTFFIENIDKKGPDEILFSLRKTLRHSIKKAENQKVKIKKCETEKELRDFYNLYLKTIKKHRTIPYLFSFFQYFLNSSQAEIILAESDNKIIAGSVFLFYDKYIHYFLNASDDKYQKKWPNHLILWSQIENYLGKHYQIFDLGGTGRGSSLEIFKRGWGAKRYPIFELKNLKETEMRKSKFRNVIPFLPVTLIEKMSPSLLRYKI